MEGNKSNSGLVVSLIIFIVISLVLGGFILYDKVLSTKVEDNNKIENNNNVIEEDNNDNAEILTPSSYTTKCNEGEPKNYTVYGDVSKYSNIFEYIANQKEVAVKLNYCTNEIESEGEAGILYKTADYTLTDTEVDTFLNEMKNGVSKYLEGGHSVQCTGNLSISYKINETINNVEISMVDVQILSSTDGNIYKIIDSNINETAPSYCLYSAGTSSETIKNIINKLK